MTYIFHNAFIKYLVMVVILMALISTVSVYLYYDDPEGRNPLFSLALADVKTDMGVYPVGTPPTLPAAGGIITDPVFGTQVMRITDANTSSGAGFNTAYSYWPTFNSNNTRILAIDTYTGDGRIFTFDPNNFSLGTSIVPPGGIGSYEWAAVWSHLNPDYMYGTSGASIRRYSVTSNTWTTIQDLSSTFSNQYFHQISLSTDDDVMAFTLKNSGNYNVEGYAAVRVSTGQVLYQVATSSLDEVQIDKSGRYLVVKTGDSGIGQVEVKVIDLQATPTPTVTDLVDNDPDNSPGHSDNGSNFVVGHADWIDAITARSLSNPHDVTILIQDGTWTYLQSQHISMLADDDSWALISQFGSIANQPLNNEIWFLKTDGSGQKRRILHHYSLYSDYRSSPRANISLNGQFVAFTSNWGNSNGRLDLFVAEVPDFDNDDTTAPIVSLTAPANGATVSGSGVTVSATASDNIGVVGVQFKLDGSNLGSEDTSAPYSITWDTNTASNASHTLTAVARDAAGNSTTSSSVTVTVNNTTPPSTVSNPTISPDGGSFSSAQSVTLATATSGASIRYTTDGSTPTSTTGTLYSSAFNVSSTTTVKAIAYKSGSTDSSVTSATFTITTPPSGGGSGSSSGGGTSTTTSSSKHLVKIDNTYYFIENNVRKGITSPGILNSCGFDFGDATVATAADKALATGPLLLPCGGALVKSVEDPTVYLISLGKRYAFTSAQVFLGLGFKFSSVLVVTDPELQALSRGSDLNDSSSAHLPGTDININGTIYWIDGAGVKRPYPSLEVYNSWHINNDFSNVVPANSADLVLPVGSSVTSR